MTKTTSSGTPVGVGPKKTPDGGVSGMNSLPANARGLYDINPSVDTSSPTGLDKGPKVNSGSTEYNMAEPHFPNEVPNLGPGGRQEKA